MSHAAPGGGISRQRKDAKISTTFCRSGTDKVMILRSGMNNLCRWADRVQLTSQHCGGVNALASLPSESNLFTASKDSTVKRYCVCNSWTGNVCLSNMTQGCLGRWGLQDKQPVLEASFEGHNDWINDIIVLEDVLVSCSSDTTIKLWKADQSGRYLTACTACDRHLLGNGSSIRPRNLTHPLCATQPVSSLLSSVKGPCTRGPAHAS